MHIASFYEVIKPIKCKEYEASFSRRASLKTHSESIHECNMSFKCNDCETNSKS